MLSAEEILALGDPFFPFWMRMVIAFAVNHNLDRREIIEWEQVAVLGLLIRVM